MVPAHQQISNAISAHPVLFRTFQDPAQSPAALIADLARPGPRNQISRDELMEIGLRKLLKVQDISRIRRNLGQNSDGEVRAASCAAFRAQGDEEAIGALIGLSGVQVAVGSAILSWCFPAMWPVIDRHAWGALAAFGLLPGRHAAYRFTAADYAQYCQIMRLISETTGRRPQELDTWLYSFGKCGLRVEDVRPGM